MMTNTQITTLHAEQQNSESLDIHYIRRLMPDPSGGYTATIHELPGCIAEGDTADEALERLDSAAQSWIESAKANGYPVTPPIDYEGASGKIALRISRRLHQLASERADLEGVSLNQFVGNALASYLGQQEGMRRMAQQIENALAHSVNAFYVACYGTNIRREASSTRTIISDADYHTRGSSSDMFMTALPSKPMEQLASKNG